MTLHRRVSASSLWRAIICPPSTLLPWDDRLSPYAGKGDAVHDFVKAMNVAVRRGLDLDAARAEALAAIASDDPFRPICEAIPVEQIPWGGESEIAFALNVLTGEARVLGHDLGRRYREAGLQDDEIPGAADLAWPAEEDGERVAYVLDAKTGVHVDPADKSEQLLLLGTSAASVWGCTRARVGHLRMRDDGGLYYDWADLDALDFARLRAEVRDLWTDTARLAAMPREDWRYVEGDHCNPPNGCPAWNNCAAKTRAIVTAFEAIDGARVDGALSAEHAGRVMDRILAIESVIAPVRKRIDAYVVATGAELELAPTSDGRRRVYKVAPGDERDVVTDPAEALRTVERLCGPDFATLALDTGKGKLERAAEAWADSCGRDERGRMNMSKAEAKRRLLGALRGAGLIEKRPGEAKPRVVVEGDE